MDRTRSLAMGPDSVYMVETYRAASPDGPDPPRAGRSPNRPSVLAVIDIPGDEVALYLISAPDAASAERIVRDGGMRPIRVVPVQWDPATRRRRHWHADPSPSPADPAGPRAQARRPASRSSSGSD